MIAGRNRGLRDFLAELHLVEKAPKTGFVRRTLVRLWLAASAALAAPTALCADSSAAVIQAGKQAMSVAELQRRWLELPLVQRLALGKTDRAGLQAYIDRFVVPELLLAEATSGQTALFSKDRREKLEKNALQRAMANRIRKESEKVSPVTEADVKDYLEAHRREFDRPARVRIYRILVASEAEALEIIKKAHQVPDFDAWRNLARDKSLDKATNMRGGELGFVSADGQSDVFELQVEPALFAAAEHIKDGELVKSPVREKDKFAVVWRRGHVAAERASLGTVSAVIRAHLRESRAAKAFDDLVAELRTKYVKDVNPSRLDGIDFGETPSDRFQAGALKPDASTP